jgi:ketosteroid isomerase-like protein
MKNLRFAVTRDEIKTTIDKMTDDERFFAAAYLEHLAQVNDPAYQRMLDERMKRMNAGQKVTLEELQRIHQTLKNL